MARDYFPRREMQDRGFSEPLIRTLEKVARLADTIALLNSTTGDVEDAGTAILALQAADAAIDGRLETLEAIDPVEKDQGPAWTDATGTPARTALASYAGQTVSNPPTQAEVQALDNAAKAISQHVVAIINDLKANGALT